MALLYVVLLKIYFFSFFPEKKNVECISVPNINLTHLTEINQLLAKRKKEKEEAMTNDLERKNMSKYLVACGKKEKNNDLDACGKKERKREITYLLAETEKKKVITQLLAERKKKK